jgi:hypothetical protein
MGKILFVLAGILAAGTACAETNKFYFDFTYTGQNTLDLTGYTVGFDDDFSDASRLHSQQHSILGDSGNPVLVAPVGSWFAPVHAQGNGDAYHVDPDAMYRPTGQPQCFSYTENVGDLTITLQQANGAWYSGSMQTADWRNQGYTANKGYFEIVAKFVQPVGRVGSWYAFWLVSQEPKMGGANNERIEIDWIEAYGKEWAHHAAVHITIDENEAGDPSPEHLGDITGASSLSNMGIVMSDQKFHKYAGLITDTHLIWYMDDKEISRVYIGDKDEFTRAQFHMVVTLAGLPRRMNEADGPFDMVIQRVRHMIPPAVKTGGPGHL